MRASLPGRPAKEGVTGVTGLRILRDMAAGVLGSVVPGKRGPCFLLFVQRSRSLCRSRESVRSHVTTSPGSRCERYSTTSPAVLISPSSTESDPIPRCASWRRSAQT
jgi:hypothetical protein